jgi:hypothetical protein
MMVGFFLFGCQSNDSGNDILELSKTVDINDVSESFIINQEHFDVYTDSQDPLTAYVDIEEFLVLVTGCIQDYRINKFGVLSIQFDFPDPSLGPLIIEFDAAHDTIHYNDFDLATEIGADSDQVYDTSLGLKEFEKVGSKIGKTINLTNYDINIAYYKGGYYIPLYLANLILTGYNFNVYLNKENLYLFDDPTTMTDIFSGSSLEELSDESGLVDQTVNFAALLFDNFYGLNPETSVSDFTEYFEENDFFDFTSIEKFDERFQEYLYGLDDLHTQILDLGYHNQSVSSVSPGNSKFQKVAGELADMGIMYKYNDISFTEREDYYYLEILTFDLDTKDHLAEYFQHIDSTKDIYIDLGCNLGGNVIAVFELLSYMTDEPISLNYMNPVTKTYSKETYQVTPGRALKNHFVIFTSGATFSAANLFVSLVQENDLGVVIGRKTAGGAAVVDYTILPNNMVMSYSTNIILTDHEGNSIEDGVDPTIVLPHGWDFNNAYRTIKEYLYYFGTFSVVSDSTAKDIVLDVSLSTIPDLVDFDHLTVNVYNASDDTLIDTYNTDSLDFLYEKHFNNFQTYIRVEVVGSYQLLGLEIEEVIFSQEVDGMAEELTLDTLHIQVETWVPGFNYTGGEMDFVVVTIPETGIYVVKIGNHNYSGNKVYDTDGNLIASGNFFLLDPGTYILEINQPGSIGEYYLYIAKYFDDNMEGTPVTLTEGEHQVTLSIDFTGDQEWIELSVPQESAITVAFTNIRSDFYIAYPDGTKINNSADNLRTETPHTFLLPKGNFLLKFHRELPVLTFSVSFEVTPVENDLSGDIFLTDDNYGILTDGDNYMTFDGAWDQDIYEFTILDAVDIQFDGDGIVRTCLITEDGLDCKWDTEKFILDPGTHHFMFTSHEAPYGVPQLVTLTVLHDLSDIDHMIPITLGEQFQLTIEKDEDEDYFTFSLTELTTLRLSMVNGLSSTCDFYFDDGFWTSLLHFTYGEMIFQLPAGNFILKIGENVHDLNKVEVFDVLLDEYSSSDIHPNLTCLPIDMYMQFNLSPGTISVIQGSIEYTADRDLFWLNVTESGTYRVSYSSNYDLVISVIVDGVLNWVGDHVSIDLEPGNYYLLIRRLYDQGTADYSLMMFLD